MVAPASHMTEVSMKFMSDGPTFGTIPEVRVPAP
jgi:hypothetical protein